MKRGDPTTQPRLSLTLSHSQDKMAQAFLAQAFLDHDPKQDGGNEATGSVQNLQEYTQYTLQHVTQTYVILCCCLFIVCLSQLLVKAPFINSTPTAMKIPTYPT